MRELDVPNPTISWLLWVFSQIIGIQNTLSLSGIILSSAGVMSAFVSPTVKCERGGADAAEAFE